MIEEWRPIEGYEGLYEVSNLGRVRSVDRYVIDSLGHRKFYKGKVLSIVKNKNGYLLINLYCNEKNKKCLVHRLVAEAFVSNPDNLPEVNHKDEDKTNNRVDNLEWCNRKYNVNFGTARIRRKDTLIKNGYWTGLSREEYNKKRYQENKDKICDNMRIYYQENKDKVKDNVRSYYQKNRDRICEQKKEYYRKRKEQIQNNVKSLDDQI